MILKFYICRTCDADFGTKAMADNHDGIKHTKEVEE